MVHLLSKFVWKFCDLTPKQAGLWIQPPSLRCPSLKSAKATRRLLLGSAARMGEGLPTTTGRKEDRVQNFNGLLFNVVKHFFGNENKTWILRPLWSALSCISSPAKLLLGKETCRVLKDLTATPKTE